MSSLGSYPFDGYNVVMTGYLRKIKTGKKKWFVLRRSTRESSARLEYYDSEKKYQNGVAPKRVYPIKNCLNVTQTNDNKHKHVLSLYTKDECIQIAVEDDSDFQDWFKEITLLWKEEEKEQAAESKSTRCVNEWMRSPHSWTVHIANRGIGTAGYAGSYQLCLGSHSMALIRVEGMTFFAEIQLTSIRSCGSLRNYLFMEVGRGCELGAGELWLETEDHNIALNLYSTIYHAMTKTNGSKDELGPKSRIRSSSATESSKPNNGSKQKHSKTHLFSQGIVRERCDSMPSRARTSSEGTHNTPLFPIMRPMSGHRPMSVHREVGQSPVGSPISPMSAGASTDSAGSSYSLGDDTEDLETNVGRYTHSLTPDEAIAEEDCDSAYVLHEYTSPVISNYLPMGGGSSSLGTGQGSDDGYVDMSPRDMRFTDYQLEKVISCFQASDDEGRPMRTYSVGSKPEYFKNKKLPIDVHTPPTAAPETAQRTRAFSVGAKTKSRTHRVLPPSLSNYPIHPSPKSSSAPMLSGSMSKIIGSNSSIGGMTDLMEMDFTRERTASGTSTSSCTMVEKDEQKQVEFVNNNSSNADDNSGYVEMKPGVTPNESAYLDMSCNALRNKEVPYLDMKSGSSAAAKKEDYTFVDITKQYQLNPNDYLDMDPKKTSRYHKDNSYMEIDAPITFKTQNSVSPQVNSGYMDMSFNSRNRKIDEGYMDMTLGKGHQRQSSDDSVDFNNVDAKNPDEYSVVEASSIFSRSSQDNNGSTPIQIPTKMQLPLGNDASPNSSLRRTRKNSRKDSRESSTNSSLTNTPSGSTMFPLSLNSPSSPPKRAETTIKVPPAVLSTVYKGGRSNRDDYVSFERSKKENNPDYVNCVPSSSDGKFKVDTTLTDNLSLLGLTESKSQGFRPIRTSENALESEQADSGCSSPAAKISRPNSVDQDSLRLNRSNSSTSQSLRPESVIEVAGKSPATSPATAGYVPMDFRTVSGPNSG